MNKTLRNISSLVPNVPNYQKIKQNLDFGDCQTEETKNIHAKKTYKFALSMLVVFTVATFMAIFVPTIINNNIQKSPSSHSKTQAHVLKNQCVDQTFETPSISRKDVTKINTFSAFEEYVSRLKSFDITTFSNEISESTFKAACVFGIMFYCCSSELNLEKNGDGRGPEIDRLQIQNNVLTIYFSVPKIGYDEAIFRITFFAICSKNSIDDNFEYIYDITQRNNGKKGSSYYLL